MEKCVEEGTAELYGSNTEISLYPRTIGWWLGQAELSWWRDKKVSNAEYFIRLSRHECMHAKEKRDENNVCIHLHRKTELLLIKVVLV